jgi:coproporphyrinogen III oxidase-like Fe-S oxidoreductase
MIAAMLDYDMPQYDMPLWRPPSEGNNLIIQATIGCSFNRCTFCSMYRTKTFRARPRARVFADIEAAARAWPEAHRVFLADGDALVLPTDELLAILDKLAASFPNLARVSSYAMPANLIKKSVDELAALKSAKLTLLYYGLEWGDAGILKRVTKGASPRAIIQGLAKARDAGLKVSATVILGLGGRSHWRDHIDGTAAVVNQAAPNFLSTLQLGLDPMIETQFRHRFGEPFEPQDDAGMLAEQRRLIAQLDPPTPVIFRSNHASNALPLAGTLPKDRDALLAALDAAQAGAIPLRPAHLRGH